MSVVKDKKVYLLVVMSCGLYSVTCDDKYELCMVGYKKAYEYYMKKLLSEYTYKACYV